ncbi:MerR family transcriptional regulator [Paenibacillus sp. WLX2291]|uniref:MerR family transcriptional regulator n=1 Tax=Paenibacillus sp. WLX2291 TaxID=3296934 RepID=UPI0039843C8B
MLSISQVTAQTGLTAYTLRYYEQIGVLQNPKRKQGGARIYSESDVKYIQCLVHLKKLGLSLEEITEFTRDGCVMEKIKQGEDPAHFIPTLSKRTEILSKYLEELEAKRQELDGIIAMTREKLAGYHELAQDL